MIKVAHFIHGLNTGGAETLVKDYMLNFASDNLDVVLICLNRSGNSPYEKELEDKKIRVIYIDDILPFRQCSSIPARAIRRILRYFAVRKVLHREAPDILHAHLLVNDYIKFARLKKETIIFYTVHSEPKKIWNASVSRQKDLKAARWLVRKYGMRFIVLHKEMCSEVNKMFGVNNTIVLNNGVDVDAIKKAASNTSKRAELGIPEEDFVVGHVGRFMVQKNHGFLVDVFHELSDKSKNVFLLMIGDGSEKENIEKKIDEYGLMGKYKILSNRNDVSELLSVMDIFVFPSLYEGLPLSLIEAQIAGKPCFISDSINKYADISNLVVRMSLKQSPKEWADVILSYKKPERIVVNVDDWDIKKITKDLERIYIEAFSENKNGSK